MNAWMLGADGVVATALAALVTASGITRRLLLPRQVYLLGVAAGFLAWGAYPFIRGQVSFRSSPIGTLWFLCYALLPLTLPLLAGLAGWLAARPPWRWVLLATGTATALLPPLGGLFVYLASRRGP